MARKFKGVYQNLERGRWFYTIWVALPDESKNVIRENLQEIKPYCEWISTMTDNHSKDIPHISLRYLGFSDELEREKVKKDIHLFEEAISGINDLEIEVGDVGLWTREGNGSIEVARLNWEISKAEPLIELHNRLLSVPNYYFFANLEGENYSPHISLGSVNLEEKDNYEIVKKYLERNDFPKIKFKLEKIELNLTSPDNSELIPLRINR